LIELPSFLTPTSSSDSSPAVITATYYKNKEIQSTITQNKKNDS